MKKNFTTFKSALIFICAFLLMQFGNAQRIDIAGWNFPINPGAVNTYTADCGSGTIYLDGTHGSSAWTVGLSNNESDAASYNYSGVWISSTSISACGVTTSTKSITFCGNNGNSAVIVVSTNNLKDIMMSYDTQVSGSGARNVVWSHSTDGVNFEDDTTFYYTNSSTFKTSHIVDFTGAVGLNNQDSIYLRITLNDASATNGSYRLDNILITGESNVPTTQQPVFSVTGGNTCTPIDVTITSEEGANIYYTTDGTDPDDMNGTPYTGPVHIAATTTLRAVAYAPGLAVSFEATATYTFPTEVATISQFKSMDGDFCMLTCPVTAVFQNGSYLFVEDEAHTGLCIYGNVGANFVNGDIITGGICGSNTTYNAIIEMGTPHLMNAVPTSGAPVEPVSVTFAQLRNNWNTYDSRLVTVSGVTFQQSTISSGASAYQKIYQGGDSLGCGNTFNTIGTYTIPLSTANVTGITINNATIKRISPRNASDIADLMPSITIVSPSEGLVIEQGTAVHVDVDIENFSFENGCMVEGKLLINGQPVTTQYLHSGSELNYFENMNLAQYMTTYGTYTVIMSLVNADSTQFTIPAIDSVHFIYQDVYVAIETSESSLSFTETGESHTFTVTAFRLNAPITVSVDNSAFTVTPTTLTQTAQAETVTVTFTGSESATGTVTLTSGTTTATVTLHAVIPIDTLIYSVGFEAAEGFAKTTTYNNDNPAFFGPEGQQWGVVHGSVSSTGAIVGAQSMLMRFYGSTTSAHFGHTGYTYTNFDLRNVTKVEFSAKTPNGLKLRASFSHDGGENYEGDSLFATTGTPQRYTYYISDSGQYNFVRVKFAVVLPVDTPNGSIDVHIDSVMVYGVLGIEADIVETPVISADAGIYMSPFNASITCETEGARIYYTTDGTTPTENSTQYTAPIEISNSCTLKARAFKGGFEASNTATAEYIFPVSVATIADFKAAGALNDSVTYAITGDVTFVYRNARRIFIEDATGGLLVYDEYNPVVTGTYNEGDIISGGIIGTYTVFNGMQELIPTVDWAAASGTATVTPTVVTAADITGDFDTYEARLVRINNGTFAEEASFNTSDITDATFADGTGEVVFRNQFKTLDTTVNAGDTVDIIGLASIYVLGGNTTYQIFPRTNADIIPVIADTTHPEDTVGIHTLDFVKLTVYPNPTSGEITVTTDRDGGSLELLNAFGQVVYRANAPIYPMTINLSDKAAGLYFVRIITDDQRIAIVKITKE